MSLCDATLPSARSVLLRLPKLVFRLYGVKFSFVHYLYVYNAK